MQNVFLDLSWTVKWSVVNPIQKKSTRRKCKLDLYRHEKGDDEVGQWVTPKEPLNQSAILLKYQVLEHETIARVFSQWFCLEKNRIVLFTEGQAQELNENPKISLVVLSAERPKVLSLNAVVTFVDKVQPVIFKNTPKKNVQKIVCFQSSFFSVQRVPVSFQRNKAIGFFFCILMSSSTSSAWMAPFLVNVAKWRQHSLQSNTWKQDNMGRTNSSVHVFRANVVERGEGRGSKFHVFFSQFRVSVCFFLQFPKYFVDGGVHAFSMNMLL